jgi:peptidyl-prolyl cis-trans isomerase C
MRYVLGILLAVSIFGCSGKVATVDGRSVSPSEFDAYLKLKHVDSKNNKQRKALLEQYLQREALAAAIEKTDSLDKPQVQAEVNEFRKEVLISRYFDRFLKEQLSDEAVGKYYKEHPEEFTEKQVHAANILIRTHAMMSQEQRQAMLDKARQIREQIKSGKSFAEMAEKNSQDKATAAKGGDLGWIKEEAMGRQFSDAAFKLQGGEVSEPVETPLGYHLITVLEPTRTVTKSLAAVAGQIRHKLKSEIKNQELKRLMATVRVKNNL